MSTIMDDYPPAIHTLKWWDVECKDVVSENGIGRLNVPNYKINLLEDHPLLWEFERSVHLTVNGKVQSLSKLLGDMFLTHIKACGNWLDFNGIVAGLHWRLQTEGKAELLLPQRLLAFYQPVLERHGLDVIIKPGWDETPGLKVLLIGNPHHSPDNYRFGQVYVIAKSFTAKIVPPNRGFANIPGEE